jgi:glycine hydroxymethyltransferase
MFDESCRIRGYDDELADAIDAELQRQQDHVELIASENYTSLRVMEAQGSVLTNKYAEGYPGKRYYGGCEFVDVAENLARERAKELFGANYANVQPHSGSQANAAAYHALLDPGDTILGMSLNEGGHLTHGSPVNFSGKLYKAVQYGIDNDTGLIDYGLIADLAEKHRPRLLIGGFSAYSRRIDWARMREIADSVGAWFLVDMAHVAGLVAAGLYPNPVPHAHVVTSTTHKTLRGPRGGIILANADDKMEKALNSVVFPGTQGGPLMHAIAGKAVAFKEALDPEFRLYQHQVIDNARAMAAVIMARGYRIVSGGTDNHLFLVDLIGRTYTGKEAEESLGRAGITVNKNTVPGEPRSPFVTSGLRLGTPAVTTRGFTVADCEELAGIICDVLDRVGDAQARDETERRAGKAALALCRKHPVYATH